MARAKIYYRAYRASGSITGYEILTLHIFEATSYPSNTPTLVLEWQTDEGKAEYGWYGLHIGVEHVNSLERWNQINRIVRRLLKEESGYNSKDWTPEEILDRLEAMKAVQVVYDSRLHEYVAIDQVPEAWLKCWLDDYKLLGRPHGCMVNVLAPNEADAKGAVKAKLFEKGCHDYLADFIKAGEPVLATNDTAPSTTTARELIEL